MLGGAHFYSQVKSNVLEMALRKCAGGEGQNPRPWGRQAARPAALSLKHPKFGGGWEGARQVVWGIGTVSLWKS